MNLSFLRVGGESRRGTHFWEGRGGDMESNSAGFVTGGEIHWSGMTPEGEASGDFEK